MQRLILSTPLQWDGAIWGAAGCSPAFSGVRQSGRPLADVCGAAPALCTVVLWGTPL